MPSDRETAPRTPDLLPALHLNEPDSPLEALLSEDDWEDQVEALPYKLAEPSRRSGLRTNRKRLDPAAKPVLQNPKKPIITTPKKPKGIVRVGTPAKSRKRAQEEIAILPEKIFKSPYKKRPRGKKV